MGMGSSPPSESDRVNDGVNDIAAADADDVDDGDDDKYIWW